MADFETELRPDEVIHRRILKEIGCSLALANIAAPNNFHIHSGTATQQGGVLIGLGVPGGSLSGSTFAATVTVSGGDIADMSTVIANPTNFYLNIHNAEFTRGAVRGQVPEPSTSVFTLVGALCCTLRRRR